MHLAPAMEVFQYNIEPLCAMLYISLLKKQMTDGTSYADTALFALFDRANPGQLCAVSTRYTITASLALFCVFETLLSPFRKVQTPFMLM
jgi:hypothetical protein